jgi:hypothetical protein
VGPLHGQSADAVLRSRKRQQGFSLAVWAQKISNEMALEVRPNRYEDLRKLVEKCQLLKERNPGKNCPTGSAVAIGGKLELNRL